MRKRNIEFLNQAKEKWNSDSIAERRDVVTNFVESVLGQFKVRVQKRILKYSFKLYKECLKMQCF